MWRAYLSQLRKRKMKGEYIECEFCKGSGLRIDHPYENFAPSRLNTPGSWKTRLKEGLLAFVLSLSFFFSIAWIVSQL